MGEDEKCDTQFSSQPDGGWAGGRGQATLIHYNGMIGTGS